jgi:hypothetical protein
VTLRDFLLTGRTGVGKSSFINYILQRDGAEVDPYVPCTSRIEPYVVPGARFFDSPGLAEGTGQKDEQYLEMVKDQLREIRLDGLVYISPLNERRFREEEQNTLRKLTTKLEAKIWRSAWLLFTFAADIPAARRHEAAGHRLADIAAFLQELSAKPGCGPLFEGFRAVLMVDNVTPGWLTAGWPLLPFFCDQEPAPQERGPVADSYYPLVKYWEPVDRRPDDVIFQGKRSG